MFIQSIVPGLKGVGKYDKYVEILKMLAAPPMGGKFESDISLNL